MLKKVTEAVNRFNLFNGAKHITVALSGGADSMALLDVLLMLKAELGIKKISAAHFNHQIRGEEALNDQVFVSKWCEGKDVELYLGEADVPKYAQEHHLSLELAARKLRYEFFDKIDTDLIATAHTASDNIETVLFNLTRGTALAGLCGIPPKRDRYIRPLILCTRDDIEAYCRQSGIDFVTDSTNLCDDYTRNKIRHNVVPILKSINKSAENSVSRMTATIREDNDFINSTVDAEYKKRYKNDELILTDFNLLHKAIAKRLIALFFAKKGVETDNFHINQAYDICVNGGKISLHGCMAAVSNSKSLKLCLAKPQAANIKFDVQIEKKENDLFENCQNVHNLLLKNVLDCDKIVGQLLIRGRMSGDTIRLKNKNCTKTLKKLFCEYKIPTEKRDAWPVISDDEGVVWIYKIGVADRCAADKNSQNIFKINVQEIKGNCYGT